MKFEDLALEVAKARVNEIAQASDDPEQAHLLEDKLHQDTLQAIANGAGNAAELAAEVLKSLNIDFPRWCA